MRMSTPCCSRCVAKLCRSECGRNWSLKPHLLRALLKADRAVASGRWVTIRRLGNSHLLLRWVFQTSRSISTIDSVNGSARSLFRLPMTRRSHLLGVNRRDRQCDRLPRFAIHTRR